MDDFCIDEYFLDSPLLEYDDSDDYEVYWINEITLDSSEIEVLTNREN